MTSWTEHLENPVLIKELRSRMRGAKPYWIMLGYIGILVLIFWISYGSWRTNTEATASNMGKFGETLFASLTITQLILCFMLAPALTSGAITIEREQRTFDLLLITLLRPGEIFVGKLLSALSYLALLLVSSLPLMALSFLFGGVSPMDLAISFLVILCSGLFFGIVGLGASCMFPRTAAATAVAYGATLLIAGATVFADVILPKFYFLNFLKK
ncbi:MAG TPA: hypothetical protein EYP10_11090 [Armatimonadetes bacterium]|nr:hypothetical protein [Armatimonadota bacterium]